jgi:ABC-type oligopeptide transport system ATPase subunit
VLDVMVLLAKEGMTMMVVTHEMGFARKVANRVIFMDHGHIVEDATQEDFFGKPRSERAQAVLAQDPASLTRRHCPGVDRSFGVGASRIDRKHPVVSRDRENFATLGLHTPPPPRCVCRARPSREASALATRCWICALRWPGPARILVSSNRAR